MTAKVLDIIVKRVADLSHFEASYLTGNAMSPNHQNETLESFRSGKVYHYMNIHIQKQNLNCQKKVFASNLYLSTFN